MEEEVIGRVNIDPNRATGLGVGSQIRRNAEYSCLTRVFGEEDIVGRFRAGEGALSTSEWSTDVYLLQMSPP